MTWSCQVDYGYWAHRVNVLISGGTGSGKTTMLELFDPIYRTGRAGYYLWRCLRVAITTTARGAFGNRLPIWKVLAKLRCAIWLKNCLRMRPEQYYRWWGAGAWGFWFVASDEYGARWFDRTVHANNPREALSRWKIWLRWGVWILTVAVREQISSAINVIIVGSTSAWWFA